MAAGLGAGSFVVGPAPACEPAQDDRVRALSAGFAQVAAQHGAPFAGVVNDLCANAAWTGEAAAGDGVHPAAGGYAALAGLVLAAGWLDWLAGLQAG
jgi:lysophospholipase L1-like esterase